MKAKGKNKDGDEIEFIIYYGNEFFSYYHNLIELKIPNGVEIVHCESNNLTELNLPNSIKNISCSNNKLTELKLPNDVQRVYCFNNPIKELTLPKSIQYAELPLNCNVLNINDFKNRTDKKIKFQ